MISVCMASYNGEAFIREQVQSILSEISVSDELIVSDDGSNDKTVSILRSIDDPRLKVITNNRGSGVTANFENVIAAAKGSYIFLSDQDDVWLPGRVQKSIELLSSYDLVVCDAVVVDQHLDPILNSAFSIRGVGNGFWSNFFRIRYLGCCMAFRRELLLDILPFPQNHKLITHDSWIALVGELFHRTYVLRNPYVLYRRHGGNLSEGGWQSSNTLYQKLMIRIYGAFCLARLGLRKLFFERVKVR